MQLTLIRSPSLLAIYSDTCFIVCCAITRCILNLTSTKLYVVLWVASNIYKSSRLIHYVQTNTQLYVLHAMGTICVPPFFSSINYATIYFSLEYEPIAYKKSREREKHIFACFIHLSSPLNIIYSSVFGGC